MAEGKSWRAVCCAGEEMKHWLWETRVCIRKTMYRVDKSKKVHKALGVWTGERQCEMELWQEWGVC